MIQKAPKSMISFLLCLFFVATMLSAGYTKETPRAREEFSQKTYEKGRTYGSGNAPLRKVARNIRLEDYLKGFERKDAFLPILAQLATRHLSGVKNPDDLDKIFDQVLQRHPSVKPDHLKKIINAYNSLPTELKNQKFEMPASQENGKATTGAVPLDNARALLYKSIGYVRLPGQNIKNAKPEETAEVKKSDKESKTASVFGIDPPLAEPGKNIHITGIRFEKEKTHHVIFAPISSPLQKEEKKVMIHPTSDREIICDIPSDIYPGKYEIRVESPDYTITKNKVEYEVSAPQYMVSFDTMHCIQKTLGEKNNKTSQDFLVTMWTVVADGKSRAKTSHKYGPFSNGIAKDYYSTDKYMLMADEGYTGIRYGLAIQSDLYEWSATVAEPEEIQEIADFSFDLAQQIVKSDIPEWDLTNPLFLLVGVVNEYVIDIFTNKPVLITSKRMVLSAVDLQKKLKAEKEVSYTGEFANEDNGGVYKLDYSLLRK